MDWVTQQTKIDMKKMDEYLEKRGEKILEDLEEKENYEKKTMIFFGSMSKNVETTWVISFFVFLHLVVFCGTMIVNNCWSNSHGDCTFIFFQPLSENPFLGPTFSALDRMGALRTVFFTNHRELWRLFTSPLLHAGLFHLLISLPGVIYVGINLEQKYGPLTTGIIYILSAVAGSLVATLFVHNSPVVCSSSALFGLIGASYSGLIQHWKSYDQKFQATVILLILFGTNFTLGLLPFIDNFSNLAGFMSGILLGYVIFFHPQLRKPALEKGLFDYGEKKSVTFKEKLDRPVLRVVCLLLFIFMVAGLIVACIWGVDANKYCSWCQTLDCLHSKNWICDIKNTACKVTEIKGQTLLRCLQSDNYKILPFTKVSRTRLEELCNLICT